MTERRVARSPRISPRARACTRTLPSAVASTGPAMTGRPQASAVSWHRSSLRLPPRAFPQDLAWSVPCNGARHDGQAAGVCCELAQKLVAAAAADNMDDGDVASREPAGVGDPTSEQIG